MPYGPHVADDRARMLARIGVASVDDLFEDIPAALRATPLRIDPAEPELELSQRAWPALAARNRVDLASFLGAGAYRHWTPPAVDQLLLRGEWYTAYTPYQPEVSQGTLQSIYEYQTLLAELTGLDVVSASHYDGGAATAEAALMTCRATRRDRLLISRGVHPHYRQTLRTYAEGAGPRGRRGPAGRRRARGRHDGPRGARAAARRSRPAGRGRRRGPALGPRPARGHARASGASPTRRARCSSSVIEPVSLAVLAPPGEYGADIAAGEGQPLGIPLQYGGPYLGIVACTDALVRQIPGRLVGPHDGPRRAAGVRHDAARARAGHPAREGGQQHLHQPGAARAGGVDLPRHARAARAARRRGAGRRAGHRARVRARGGRRPAAARRPVPQRARRPRPRRAGRPRAAARPRRARGHPDGRRCCPTSRRSPTGCSCARPRSRRPRRSTGSPTRCAPSWAGPPGRHRPSREASR